ncbi:MAG: hypothetical protein HC924_07315 [Synechococcaceae cyanobacterium SM2_3_2]|nr:hypothetical protein [Synechococcaceae cyanobacterium SM2_3_2]
MKPSVISIIQTALQTGSLSASQEDLLNSLLFGSSCADVELFLLRRLYRAIADGTVHQVRYDGMVVAGNFGIKLRALPAVAVNQSPEAL